MPLHALLLPLGARDRGWDPSPLLHLLQVLALQVQHSCWLQQQPASPTQQVIQVHCHDDRLCETCIVCKNSRWKQKWYCRQRESVPLSIPSSRLFPSGFAEPFRVSSIRCIQQS